MTSAAIGAYWPCQQCPINNGDWIVYEEADEDTHQAERRTTAGTTAKCVPLAARQSSTRVEAQGILVAASHPGPQCIATDNVGAVAGWNKLLHAIRSNTLQQLLRRRPWGLRLDGDIWEAAANLIAIKGTEAIRVIWAKGHATGADIAAGKSTEELRRGNSIADTLANAAHEATPEGKALATKHARARWEAAHRVVCSVHAFLREAVSERSTLRNMKRQHIRTQREIAIRKKSARNLVKIQNCKVDVNVAFQLEFP